MNKGCGGMNIKQESYLTIVKMIKILKHHPLSPPEEGEELGMIRIGILFLCNTHILPLMC
jgi:hypothetical protein